LSVSSLDGQMCKYHWKRVRMATELKNVANLDFDVREGQLLVAIQLAIKLTHPRWCAIIHDSYVKFLLVLTASCRR
jgi:hypothetical protein